MIMPKKKARPVKTIANRRARFDYQLGDSLVVGLALNGRETKALRLGHGQLTGSYVNIRKGELYLTNATISGTTGIPINTDEQTRERKLLARRHEIDKLIAAKQQGMTIIPLELLTQGRFIKLKISTAKGKKKYDKRETLKRKDQSRQISRQLRS